MVEHGEKVTPDAAAAMPYADAAVKEALRLSPIVAVVTRVALKTFELGGFTIPKVTSPPPPSPPYDGGVDDINSVSNSSVFTQCRQGGADRVLVEAIMADASCHH